MIKTTPFEMLRDELADVRSEVRTLNTRLWGILLACCGNAIMLVIEMLRGQIK